MILPDVNVLVIAFRLGAPDHERHAAWLSGVLESDTIYAVAPQVLSSVIRIVTNRRIFPSPAGLSSALDFCDTLITQPNCRIVQPGPRHWRIFSELCVTSKASGDLIPDAWFAALAIEHGCEWITHDGDYEKFAGLRWRPPF
jgi:toxin-antitoxin system PIN domain toxin